ncbi:ATP-binding cassette domain-containing protein [Pseudofrankia saprophytica]|uniref:ATP-binding cassette domain-containing protein n=1 Tax=Pseudofrankia saprophytica TaxID=298655 RepID=UPI0002D402D0|nr:ATP-binding cassette domain-containing protein [Pseudofrankia saprophytica]
MSAGLTVRSGHEIVAVVPEGQSCVIGRTTGGDPLLANDRVSRRHLLIESTPEGWAAVDVSTFGTWQDGWRVGRVLIHEESRLRLGAPDGPMLTLVPHPTAGPATPRSSALAVSVTAVDEPVGQPHHPDPSERPRASPWGQPAEHRDSDGSWDSAGPWTQPAVPTPVGTWEPRVSSIPIGPWDPQAASPPTRSEPWAASPSTSSWEPPATPFPAGPWDTQTAAPPASPWDAAQPMPDAGSPGDPWAVSAPAASWNTREAPSPTDLPAAQVSPAPAPTVPAGSWEPPPAASRTRPWDRDQHDQYPSRPSVPDSWDPPGALVTDRSDLAARVPNLADPAGAPPVAAPGTVVPSEVKRHHERPTLLPKKARPGSGPRMPPAEGDAPDVGAGLGRIHTLRPGRTVIGRALSSDVVVGDLLASREHAALFVDAEGVEIVDLDSANGTFVNGHRVDRAWLRIGDFFSIGHHVFHTGAASTEKNAVPTRLVEYLDRGDVTFQVDGLCVDVGETRLLHDVTFRLPGRALLGVIGPSGAGKSTLLGALTGFRPASLGTVRYSGRDLYAEYDELRRRIGYVPQDDILHTTLTVRQALEYGAQLRFPAETTRQERARRIDEVLVELGLTNRTAEARAGRSSPDSEDAGGHRRRSAGARGPDGDHDDLDDVDDQADGLDEEVPRGVDLPELKVSKLSGGQRKRTSVALELLTQPTLLYLDEPTSGLDPDLDKEVMGSLRRLADGGRTVVVVTHSVANLDHCDYLLVLAKGGHVAYFGPPANALEFFRRDNWSDAFHLLKNPTTAVKIAHRYRNSKYFIRGSATVPRPRPAPLESIRQQSVISQALTLSRRYLRVIASDPSYLRLLVAYPIVLGLIPRTLPAAYGLAVSTNPAKANTAAPSILLVLILMACFMGMSNSIRELVKEREIYRRERGIGLSTAAYLVSKVAVLGIITTVQSVVLTLVGLAGMKITGHGVVIGIPLVEIMIATAATAITSAMMGLAVSALVDNADKTLPPLVVVAMAQLVFMGAMMPLAGKAGLEQISWLFPARWGYGASASVVDLITVQRIGDERFAPGIPVDPLWRHTAATYLTDLGVVVLIGLVCGVVAARLLRRLDPLSARRGRARAHAHARGHGHGHGH